MKTTIYIQILKKLYDDQWVNINSELDGMFGKNRPSNDRKLTNPNEKNEFKNQVFMTFNAIRTLDILKPNGYNEAISNAVNWTENMMNSKDAYFTNEKYFIHQSFYDEESKGVLNYRHTIGLASILLYTNHRLDIVESIIKNILDKAQNNDGGWKLKADSTYSCIISSIWAVVFLKLIINSQNFNNFTNKAIAMLNKTLKYYDDNINEDGYWVSAGKGIFEKVNNGCVFIPEFSSEFYYSYPNSFRKSLFFLESLLTEDGDLNQRFYDELQGEKISTDDKFRFLLRITFVFYTSLFLDDSHTRNFYLKLRQNILKINPINIQLKTLDICKYLFLLKDLENEKDSEYQPDWKERFIKNIDKIIKLKIPLVGFGSFDLNEFIKTLKNNE